MAGRSVASRERFKNRRNKSREDLDTFKFGRSRSPSPNRPISPTLESQASSTPVGPDVTSIHSLVPGRSRSPTSNRSISPPDFPAWESSAVDPDLTSIRGISQMTGQVQKKDHLTNKSKPSSLLSSPVFKYNVPLPPSSRRQIRPPSYVQPYFNVFNFNLPSLSNRDPSRVIYSAGADLASSRFQDVKTILRRVEEATDLSMPLKSTVAGLLGVIDVVEVCHFQLSVVIVMVLTTSPDSRSEHTRSRSGPEAESCRLNY